MDNFTSLPLGKKIKYINNYDKSLLVHIARSINRSKFNIENININQNFTKKTSFKNNIDIPFGKKNFAQTVTVPVTVSLTVPLFYGYDIWNAYEIFYLDEKGKPNISILEIIYNANSPFIVESKSLKMYLNSFNNTKINDNESFVKLIQSDLSELLETDVAIAQFDIDGNIINYNNSNQQFNKQSNKNNIHLYSSLQLKPKYALSKPNGYCLDVLDMECPNSIQIVKFNDLYVNSLPIKDCLHTTNNFKMSKSENTWIEVYSNLLKSNCPVTNQPDFGTVIIQYIGTEICNNCLLKYIVSYRNHQEFHEHCIERMFVDIMDICKPKALTIFGKYTRRGGIDINPIRSTEHDILPNNIRMLRQ